MAASHCCISNVIRARQESESTKSCGFCNGIHCSHRCEYSECRSISRRLKLSLGGGYYGPFTLFRVGREAEDYIKVSREHEHAAILPRKVAGIYMVGTQKPFRRRETYTAWREPNRDPSDIQHVVCWAIPVLTTGSRVTLRTSTSSFAVGIATDYGMEGPGSNHGEDEIFFCPSRPVLGAHPASCTMGTGSFPGVEAAGAWGWHPTPLN